MIRSQLSCLEMASRECIQQLRGTFAQLRTKLDQREAELVEQAREMHTQHKQRLMEQAQRLRMQSERATQLRAKVRAAVESSSATMRLACDDTHLAEVEQHLQPPEDPTAEMNFIQFDYTQGLEDFVVALSKLTQMASTKPLPAKTAIELPTSMVSSVKAAVKVTVSDAAGGGLSNYPITGSVVDPCGDEVPCRVTCREEGVYALQLRPQMPGKHRMSLNFMGQPLWGTEQEFRVKSNNPVMKAGGDGEMNRPTAVAVGPDDRIYVADMGNKRVLILDQTGKTVGHFKLGGSTVTTYDIAINIATEELLVTKVMTNEDGRLVANKVRIFGLQGEQRRQFAHEKAGRMLFVAVNSKGYIICTDSVNHCVYIFSKEGKVLKTLGKLGEKPGELNFPSAVAVDPDDNIIVVDTKNHRIQIFAPNGKFVKSFGEEGSLKGQLRSPRGVATDAQGNILVADSQNRIQVFNKDGEFVSCIDSSDDRINEPYNMATTKDGHVLVADFRNNCIKKYRYQ